MRINNGVIINNFMKNLQENMDKLDKLNQQLSSGKKFSNPSENPIGAANSMEISNIISGHEQYLDNIGEAKDWMASTESALKNSGKILQRAREQAVYGANGALSEVDREQIAEEIEQLRKELVNISNSRLGERYLFAGQKTDMSIKPFAKDGSYEGDHGAIRREVSPGVDMKINVDGKETFKKAIEDLQDLEDALRDDKPDDVNDLIDNVDDAIRINTKKRAQIGAKMNRLEMTQSKLEDEKIQSKELLSKNEDVDIAKTITNLKMQESVYRASLASGARIIQPSLVDFLQ